jgi:uncharacterized protein
VLPSSSQSAQHSQSTPIGEAALQIGFGEIRHTRLRPHRHAFSYRSFFLRLAMHELSGTSQGNWLFGINRRAALSIQEQDHGDGSGNTEWLHALLRDSGLPPASQLWLHAFPRLFGYTFKPVSFWFCHGHDGALFAIVAEVHNTFGERHCYLLSKTGAAPLKQGESLSASKAFHVSPFCDIEGRYRFRFLNSNQRSCARIDYDDSAGPLLATSLSGHLEPLTRKSAGFALLAYPLFTFGVIARIHWQALRLWRNKIPFRSKPPAPQAFVTRGSA